jgi:hypothetical protein
MGQKTEQEIGKLECLGELVFSPPRLTESGSDGSGFDVSAC